MRSSHKCYPTILGWFSNRTGTSFKKKKKRESTRKGLNSTSGTKCATLPLAKPVVRFASAVVNWRSRSVAKLAYCNETRRRLLFTCASFSSTYGKNSIAHRGPVLWNTLIFKDNNFLNISYKDLKRKTRSMDIFKELTFKETSTTTNFRR